MLLGGLRAERQRPSGSRLAQRWPCFFNIGHCNRD